MDDRADTTDPLREEHNLLPGPAPHDPLDPFLHVPELKLGPEHPFTRCLAFEADGFFPAGMHRPERYGYIDGLFHDCFSS